MPAAVCRSICNARLRAALSWARGFRDSGPMSRRFYLWLLDAGPGLKRRQKGGSGIFPPKSAAGFSDKEEGDGSETSIRNPVTAHVRKTEKRWFPAEDETLPSALVSEQPLLHQRRKPPAPTATDASAHGAQARVATVVRRSSSSSIGGAVRHVWLRTSRRVSVATTAASSHSDGPR